MGWYDSKRKTLDVDSSKISTSGALTAKAISDAFMGVAQVVEDRNKQKIQDEKDRMDAEKSEMDLSKSYDDIKEKAIDKAYLGYVDAETGEFKKDQFEKDNVGLPINEISKETRDYQQKLKDAYATRYKAEQENENKAAANEIASVMLNSSTKEEFMKNINPETFKKADAQSLLGIESFYNKKANELAQINNAKENLANQTKLSKLELKLEEEKIKSNKEKPKEVKAADASTIDKMVSGYFGGEYNPSTQTMTLTDPMLRKTASAISSRAAEIYRTSETPISHNEAATMALKEYDDSIKEPKPTANDDPFGWKNK